jgi:dTDP-4-dehydrorhamnose 3,5-epimerase
MRSRPGPVEGVVWEPLQKYADVRGWLCELFRQDELPAGFSPAMASLSLTGLTYLWDARPSSPTRGNFQTRLVRPDRPVRLIVPPGVVHAYKNVSAEPGLVFNAPNRLYRGPGRNGPVDEVRHEVSHKRLRAGRTFPGDTAGRSAGRRRQRNGE